MTYRGFGPIVAVRILIRTMHVMSVGNIGLEWVAGIILSSALGAERRAGGWACSTALTTSTNVATTSTRIAAARRITTIPTVSTLVHERRSNGKGGESHEEYEEFLHDMSKGWE